MADAEALRQAIRDKAQAITEAAAALTLEVVQGVCPVGETGDLRDSLEIDEVTEVGEGIFTTKIRATAPYASFTDTGTAAHTEGSKTFSFPWDKDPRGREVSVFSVVDIPAIPGQNWFAEPMAETWDSATAEAAANG